MLNKQQIQFRKRMKEAEQKKSAHNPIYSYQNQRFENEKPKRRYKKPLLQIGGLVSLLVLLWNLYSFFSFLFPWTENSVILSANQFEVHQYIEKSSELELAVNNQISSLINHYNAGALTVFQVEEAQEKIFEMQKKAETEDKRFLALKAYMDEQFSLAYQVTNVLKTVDSEVKYQELTTIVEKQNALSKSKNEALIKVLENENMSYQRLENGTISYQYEF